MLKQITDIKNIFYLFTFLFLTVFIYFYWFGSYVLFFQENQSLFIFSEKYFNQFAVKPGGLLVYMSNFLTQFYTYPFVGSFLLAAVFTLSSYILYKTATRLNSSSPLLLLITLVPPGLLILMQTHYYHLMEYNLGFLMVLLFLLFSLSSGNKNLPISVLIIFPVFYYITGAYALAYLGLYLIYLLLFHRIKHSYLPVILVTGVATVTYFLFKELIFLVPDSQLTEYPFPIVNDNRHKLLLHIYIGSLALFPVLLRIRSFPIFGKNKQVFILASALPVFLLLIYYLSKFYNPQTDRVLQIEKLVVQERWEEAIAFQEKFPAENLIGQYFYNVALAETNQLTSRLFYGRQDFKTGSLILPWKEDYLKWGVHFFYTAGLINEAHRWAYEEMVIYAPRPSNIKFLVKTNLINGNYNRAEIFINMLKKTVIYKKWAYEYEKLIKDTLNLNSHPEIWNKREIIPAENFYIEVASPQINLPLLLQSNPGNKKAFEYIMAWFLLSKDINSILANLHKLRELKYEKIPQHIEEAILAYSNSTKRMPELYEYTISKQSKEKFNQYISLYNSYRTNPSQLKLKMEENFANTFWYYFHFK